jgi:hypothetical protein
LRLKHDSRKRRKVKEKEGEAKEEERDRSISKMFNSVYGVMKYAIRK